MVIYSWLLSSFSQHPSDDVNAISLHSIKSTFGTIKAEIDGNKYIEHHSIAQQPLPLVQILYRFGYITQDKTIRNNWQLFLAQNISTAENLGKMQKLIIKFKDLLKDNVLKDLFEVLFSREDSQKMSIDSLINNPLLSTTTHLRNLGIARSKLSNFQQKWTTPLGFQERLLFIQENIRPLLQSTLNELMNTESSENITTNPLAIMQLTQSILNIYEDLDQNM